MLPAADSMIVWHGGAVYPQRRQSFRAPSLRSLSGTPADRFYGQRVGRVGYKQVSRIRLVAEPAGKVPLVEDGRHAIVDRRDKVVGWNGYDRERADPLPGRREMACLLPLSSF